MSDWTNANLDDTDRAICTYVEKLTLQPAKMSASDLDPLRAAGLNDQAIHDTCAIASYFNYINRMADGLGVDLEPEMSKTPPWK